jgi:hypothetical protein
MAAGRLGYYTIPKESSKAKDKSAKSRAANAIGGESLDVGLGGAGEHAVHENSPYDIMHNARLESKKAGGPTLQGVIELCDSVCGIAMSGDGDDDGSGDEEGQSEEVRRSWMAERMSGFAAEKHSHSLAIIQSSEDRMLVDMGSSMELSRWLVALTHGTQFARGALSEAVVVRLYAQIGIGIVPDGEPFGEGKLKSATPLSALVQDDSVRTGLGVEQEEATGGNAPAEGGNVDDGDATVVVVEDGTDVMVGGEALSRRHPPAPPAAPRVSEFDDSFFG